MPAGLIENDIVSWRRHNESSDASFGGYQVFSGLAPKQQAARIDFENIDRRIHLHIAFWSVILYQLLRGGLYRIEQEIVRALTDESFRVTRLPLMDRSFLGMGIL
jgi:hypothetical protein